MPLEGREMKCVGLDVHREYIHGAVLDESGKVVESGKFPYTRSGSESSFKT